MRLAIIGCCGKMGIELIKATYNKEDYNLSVCIDSNISTYLGKDIAEVAQLPQLTGITVASDLGSYIKGLDCVVDFSSPASSLNVAKICATHGVPLVVGVTGFTSGELEELKGYSKDIPIVQSYNMSIGVCMTKKLVQLASKLLKDENYDTEIIETHHKNKVDAPSGTAILLAQSIASIRNLSYETFVRNSRSNIRQKRTEHTIGISSVRGGNIVGEHSVIFFGEYDSIEIKHQAQDRRIFAIGALRACAWVLSRGRKAGYYSIDDVVGG